MRLAHISDVHFGRIADPQIVDALIEQVNASEVDAVVVSGDLSQRARPREFAAARDFIQAFESPVLVVPGNHDVYPWWHPIKRWWKPLQRYRDMIQRDLSPSIEQPGLRILGINSAHGRTIKGGRIGEEERQRITDYFSAQPDDVFRVLVLHHHLIKLKMERSHDIARHARATLQTALRQKVDLILCGHLHISHVEPIELSGGDHQIVIASAGTATSDRGRGSNQSTNYYNLVAVDEAGFVITEYRFAERSSRFEEERKHRFKRRTEGNLSGYDASL